MDVVHHFSEDPSIERFEPHVPKTNPMQPAAVWAIDPEHAPLYWFPRDCPRATAWPRHPADRSMFENALTTSGSRLHAIEFAWLERMQTVQLYRYDFDPASFSKWVEAPGQWISATTVEPVAVAAVGDLLYLHADAGIELRLLSNLWSLVETMSDDRWDFSHVRLANAEPAMGNRPTRS